jgi:hypothetical protein
MTEERDDSSVQSPNIGNDENMVLNRMCNFSQSQFQCWN